MKKILIFAFIFIFIFSFSTLAMTNAKTKPYGKILVYTMAVDALGKIADTRAELCLVAALKSKEFFVRAYAARALGRLQDKTAIPALKKLVNDKNYMVRIMAVKALVKLGDASMEKILLSFLSDKNEAVRSTAISNLREFGTKFVPALLAALDNEKNPLVCAKIIEQLTNEKIPPTGEEGIARGIDPRLQAIRNSLDAKDWETRQAACYGIAVFEDRESIPLLIKRLSDESSYVRATAKESLGKLGEESLSKIFWQEINDKNPILKVSSIVALVNLKDIKLIPVLLKEAVESNNNSQVRKEAAKALMALKPYVYKLVDDGLTDSNSRDYISSDNLKINYKINGRDLTSIFIYALKNSKDPLHNDAPFMLGELKEELAWPSLRSSLFDNDPDIVANTAFVLGELQDREAVDDLIKVCKKYRL
jgi:HEAT repeat protein